MITYNSLNNLLHQIDPVEELMLSGKYQFGSTLVDGMNVCVLDPEPVYPFLNFPNPNIKIVKTGRFHDIPEHIHSWIEMGYMYSGSCTHTIKGQPYTLKKGQLYILDSDTPHSIQYLGEKNIHISFVFSRKYFKDSLFTKLTGNSVLSSFLINSISEHTYHDNFILFNSENNRRISTYINEILCEHLSASVNSFDIINSYIDLLFLELVNVYEADQTKLELHNPNPSIIPILKYIESNYKTCDLKGIANIFGMNPNYLTTFIKKYTGLSFKQLIQQQRFEFINMQLLNTSRSIEEIAIEAGYENTTYFYKKYKETFGCTPKEYREKHVTISGYPK
ncbi:MAG: helix-turn-helix domain-containing protein [Acetatifactor sp.]|nr:helix-turn-helix domain-containing protein [Acetatifactor sp.]